MSFLFQIILIVAGYEYISWRIKSKKSIKDWWDEFDKGMIYTTGIVISATISGVTILYTCIYNILLLNHVTEVSRFYSWLSLISYLALGILAFCIYKENKL